VADFIGYITEVLGISLTVGTTTLSLGGVALGMIVLSAGVGFFKKLKGR
jgi:hypothetical protein